MKHTIILYLILNLVLAACTSSQPTPPEQSSSQKPPVSQESTPTSTSLATAVAPAAPDTPQATVVPSEPQPVAYLLPDPAVGLDQLDSYRLSLTIAFKGKRDGQPAEWDDVHTHVFSRPPAAQFTTLTTRDENGQPLQRLSGSVDDAHYFQAGADQPCQVRWGESVAGGERLNLASLLPPIARATDIGQETVNGVPARHYSITEESNGAQATGKLWIAELGGYVVRYDLSIQANEQFFGPGMEGTQTFQYEVNEVNALQAVPLPAGCPTVLTEIPTLPDALDIMRFPGSMSFATPSSLESAEAFYQTEMKALGWEMLARHAEKAQPLVLIFTRNKGEESALISLKTEAAGVWVAVQMNEPTAP
ncbi:hypothetical protein TFLX_00694 [Thermoflexales bacterium]|nr:hypothetical protein TFLX_00694 [Thermoflexales bacterium]